MAQCIWTGAGDMKRGARILTIVGVSHEYICYCYAVTPILSAAERHAAILDSGSGAHSRGWHSRRCAAQLAAPRAAGRSTRLPAFLAGRTSRYGRYRQRSNLDRYRIRCRRHTHDSRGLRRHHAAQPRAPGRCRAVRNAGLAVSGSHRSWLGTRTGDRSAHRPGVAARPDHARRGFRLRHPGAAVLLRPGAAGTADPRSAWRGVERTNLAVGIEPVRRATGSSAGIAVRLRFTLRAG